MVVAGRSYGTSRTIVKRGPQFVQLVNAYPYRRFDGSRISARHSPQVARSGGIEEEFSFTGGVARNPAAVAALEHLVYENYGTRRVNISPESIYTGALGAAHFARRAA